MSLRKEVQTMAVKPVPDGYHTVTPYLAVKGAAKLIEFMREASGAEETFRMGGDTVQHAEVRIGDSMIMVGDAPGEPKPGMLHLYVEDVDAAYERALRAGGKSIREPEDQFYGDRSAGFSDDFGNEWWLATHIEDVSPEEIARRAAAAQRG
jgi:PhnB protein